LSTFFTSIFIISALKKRSHQDRYQPTGEDKNVYKQKNFYLLFSIESSALISSLKKQNLSRFSIRRRTEQFLERIFFR